jgi:hypothetical protein
MAVQTTEERVTTLIEQNVDLIPEDGRSAVRDYLEHGEYQMAFEGLILDLMEAEAYPEGFRYATWRVLVHDCRLDSDPTFDSDFLEKFKSWARKKDPEKPAPSGDKLLQPRYLFVFDKQERKMIESYYIADPACRVPDDVSHGAIARENETDFILTLQQKYPEDRYEFGGGSAASLEAAKDFYFGGGQIDYSHFFEDK